MYIFSKTEMHLPKIPSSQSKTHCWFVAHDLILFTNKNQTKGSAPFNLTQRSDSQALLILFYFLLISIMCASPLWCLPRLRKVMRQYDTDYFRAWWRQFRTCFMSDSSGLLSWLFCSLRCLSLSAVFHDKSEQINKTEQFAGISIFCESWFFSKSDFGVLIFMRFEFFYNFVQKGHK